MVRLAALQEQEQAARDSQEALRFATGMPALARWAQTKGSDPLADFLLHTAAALLDLSIELVRHTVLIGWVLLGVFNRLFMELITSKRPVQTAVFFLGIAFAGYAGVFGDYQDMEDWLWD